jgi:hypothetical protein
VRHRLALLSCTVGHDPTAHRRSLIASEGPGAAGRGSVARGYTLPESPDGWLVEILDCIGLPNVRVTIDHGAFETELGDRALEFVAGSANVLKRMDANPANRVGYAATKRSASSSFTRLAVSIAIAA